MSYLFPHSRNTKTVDKLQRLDNTVQQQHTVLNTNTHTHTPSAIRAKTQKHTHSSNIQIILIEIPFLWFDSNCVRCVCTVCVSTANVM